MACLLPMAVDFDNFLDDDSSSDEETYPALHQALSISFSRPPRPQQSKPRVVRQSIGKAPAPSPLRVVPFTTMEWKKAIAEVKSHYTNKRYRQCASRCQDILDRVREHHRVEKAYLIFFHFYAATALEMQVRSLHYTSPYLGKMLLQARDHYRHASEFSQAEDEFRSRSQLRLSDLSSASLQSPTSSLSSSSTVSTRASSPSPSDVSMATAKSANTSKRQKRVHFDQETPCSEPIIRPDSPTLGFDEWLGRSSPDVMIGNGDAAGGTFLSSAEESDDSSSFIFHPAASQQLADAPAVPEDEADPSMFMLEEEMSVRLHSMERYRTLLSGLQGQITSHLAMIEADIAAAEKPVPPTQKGDEEMRKLELQSRIQRLKAQGWPRRKFDAKRYEMLRDNAMADMML